MHTLSTPKMHMTTLLCKIVTWSIGGAYYLCSICVYVVVLVGENMTVALVVNTQYS